MKTLYLKSVSGPLIFLFLLSFLSCSIGTKQDQVLVPSPPPKKYQDIVSQTPKTPFENMLESTKGKNIEYMTDRFGFPAKSFKDPNANRVFEYNFSNIKKDKIGNHLISGLANYVYPGSGSAISLLSSMSPDSLQCAFWLEVNDDDVIRKWQWEGKDCKSIYQRIRQTIKSKLHGAWLGVEFQLLTSERKKAMNINRWFFNGVLVNNVIPNSPAQKSGIMKEDIITKINGQIIFTPQDLVDLISKRFPGETIQIEVYRNGKFGMGEAVLEEIPNPAAQQ